MKLDPNNTWKLVEERLGRPNTEVDGLVSWVAVAAGVAQPAGIAEIDGRV